MARRYGLDRIKDGIDVERVVGKKICERKRSSRGLTEKRYTRSIINRQRCVSENDAGDDIRR